MLKENTALRRASFYYISLTWPLLIVVSILLLLFKWLASWWEVGTAGYLKAPLWGAATPLVGERAPI